MRILVNTRLLIKNRLEGIGWFTLETMKRITQKRPNDEFIFVSDRKTHSNFVFADNIQRIKMGWPARRPFLWKLWFENTIPKAIKKCKPDVFLSPDGYLSLSANVKQLPVIHDINFEHHPEWLPKNYSKYYRKYFPQFAQKAKRVATVSEYSKQDIAKTYGIDDSNIDVVYNGYNTIYEPLPIEKQQEVRKKISNGKPYILFIGSIHPRKNLRNQLKAFDMLNRYYDDKFRLVIVGEAMWNDHLADWVDRRKKNNIILMGHQPQDKLKEIIGSASLLTYISHFEGFGIPILEGFAAGVPVITSTTTSMPEVAGDAALTVYPDDAAHISNIYKKVLFDEALQKEMIEKGGARINNFSWDKTANLLWKSIEKTYHAH